MCSIKSIQFNGSAIGIHNPQICPQAIPDAKGRWKEHIKKVKIT